uniref:Uncharacterized protein n=1 Tax=Siphoviridae sp. ctL0q1 TaxID=2825449 RepID=A0A8S5PK25_9CAUD|nr:MAG TPA: hypothetical protein [Siphoviridae sp. ctL0q1]
MSNHKYQIQNNNEQWLVQTKQTAVKLLYRYHLHEIMQESIHIKDHIEFHPSFNIRPLKI